MQPYCHGTYRSSLGCLFPLHTIEPNERTEWHAFHKGRIIESLEFCRAYKRLYTTGGEALDLNRLLVSTHLSYQSGQLSPLERARSQGDSRQADM
jgi:hypothetical protein